MAYYEIGGDWQKIEVKAGNLIQVRLGKVLLQYDYAPTNDYDAGLFDTFWFAKLEQDATIYVKTSGQWGVGGIIDNMSIISVIGPA